MFEIRKGTKQGDPLSSLLFNMDAGTAALSTPRTDSRRLRCMLRHNEGKRRRRRRQQRASCEDHSLQCLAQTSKGAVAVETDESTAEAVNFHVEDEFDLCESREVFLRW